MTTTAATPATTTTRATRATSTPRTPDPAADPAAAPVLLRAEGVRQSFRTGRTSVEILHGIDLQLRAGEACAVMGPSGSGKSTLLACLAGLERPSGGTVRLLGQDVCDLSRADLARARRTRVGFIFQAYNLLPGLTGAENVALPYRLGRRRPPADRMRQVMEALGITHLAGQRPASMSGGEQQRVAIARVLVQSPQILFADEPTGALDSASGARVLDLLVAQARQGAAVGTGDGTQTGKALLMVTHDAAVAAECDRVVMLRDGVVVDELHQPTVEDVTERLAAHQTMVEGGMRR